MFIKNTNQLLSNILDGDQLNLRKIGLTALEKAINAVKPKKIIEKSIKIQENKLMIKNDIYDLKDFDNIYIIGGGKASEQMLSGLKKILKNFPDIEYKGIINIPEGLELKNSFLESKIKINYATHPIANEKALDGTRDMMELIKKSTKKDLIFCLISGGGSALLTLPKKNISLDELKKVNSLLLASGASIQEINAVRKHLSDFKGGNLAKKLYKKSGATLISLIISDVVGDHLDSIASGPTVPDLTTYKDALNVLEKYNLLKKIPSSVINTINEGLNNRELENPKPKNECFNNVHNYLIGSVQFAAQELSMYLKEQTFHTNYFSKKIVGEAEKFGKLLYQIICQNIEEYIEQGNKDKIALIGTGELTVTISGDGIGGRNQEMLLSFLDLIKEKKINHNYHFLIIAANLDGIEGNSEAMGALIDNYTLSQTIKKEIDTKKYLDNNDSNSFFKALKSEIITGPTGCNVNDILIIFVKK